jgi:hypothetical protein
MRLCYCQLLATREYYAMETGHSIMPTLFRPFGARFPQSQNHFRDRNWLGIQGLEGSNLFSRHFRRRFGLRGGQISDILQDCYAESSIACAEAGILL